GSGATSSSGGGSGPASTSGVVAASGHLTIVQATERRAEVGVSSGKMIAGFAGFPPSSSVYLSIFGPGEVITGAGERFPLFANLPDAAADSSGTGTVSWSPPTTAPPGDYALWVDPPLAC